MERPSPARTEPLTEQEAARLDKAAAEQLARGSGFGCMTALAVYFVGAAVVTGMVEEGLLDPISVTLWIAGLVVSAFAYGLMRSGRQERARFARDRAERRKSVIEGRLDEKRERHDEYNADYSFVVDGTRVVVDLTTYTRFDEGDRVRVHRTTHAGCVVRVERVVPPLAP